MTLPCFVVAGENKNFRRPLGHQLLTVGSQISHLQISHIPIHPSLRTQTNKYCNTTPPMGSTEAVSAPFFKKKRARPTTTRQRAPSPPIAHSTTSASASSSKSQVVLPSRKVGGNLLSAGTKRTS